MKKLFLGTALASLSMASAVSADEIVVAAQAFTHEPLQQVLEGLSENEGVDARVVFLMGVMLERILHHEESSLVAEDIQEDKAGSLDE